MSSPEMKCGKTSNAETTETAEPAGHEFSAIATASAFDRRVFDQPLLQLAVVGHDRLVAEDNAVVDERAAADMAMAGENRAAHHRFLADARIRPDDGVVDRGVRLDVALAADDAVRADARAGADD